MIERNIDSFNKAKKYALLLLKYRPRCEKELVQRLKKKKFDQVTINQTISFLRERNFIDDRDFAHSWIESRIKRSFGLKRIIQELKARGVDRQIIEEQMSLFQKDYSEYAQVKEIAGERLKKMNESDTLKKKRRLYDYLLRRGFSPEVVSEVINEL